MTAIANPPDFEDETQRRRAVAWAVTLASNLMATPVRTEAATETGLYRVLYWSYAAPLSKTELLELLEQARSHNAAHQLTGVLLYSENRFVQLLEGPEPTVLPLYERIRADSRHREVETVRLGPITARSFSEWSMDFGFAASAEGTPMAPTDLPGLSITPAIIKRLIEAFIG